MLKQTDTAMIKRIGSIGNGKGLGLYHRAEQVERIQQILLKNGYESTMLDCNNLWEEHSQASEATWLMLPEDDELLWAKIKGLVESKTS